MPEIFKKLDAWAGGIPDRLLRRMPGPRISITTSRPLVSFTFDDVPDTALTNGARILEEHGVRGTFYISGSLAGSEEPDRTLITEEGCRELVARGHEIGCHTFSHMKVRHMSVEAIDADLERNEHYLAQIEKTASKRNFAYPYNAGSFSARRIFENRFSTCRMGGEQINRGSVNPVFLHGVEIRQPETHAQGLTGRIDELVAEPGWLIFFTHDIAPTPTPYGCTPETFEMLVAYALLRGCTVLPVRDALAQLDIRRP
ncbi:polysaccharide deacetylase [Phyllobacterium phragmitis]|uniref:Chitooligosaccharide deacetylase n=1 Tax=Phyllobacterium phragmitis TaxID=2670329 RepID=A0A2S9IUU9_9HYPH|nr:polysaccharide deacetylase family protein [Phyllobacterium phragmitis]PRD44304.1 polysaccharide deacetylase [Phyllobacterium phragmitis]